MPNQDLGKASTNNVLAASDCVDDNKCCVSVTNANGDKSVLGDKYLAKVAWATARA